MILPIEDQADDVVPEAICASCQGQQPYQRQSSPRPSARACAWLAACHAAHTPPGGGQPFVEAVSRPTHTTSHTHIPSTH